MQGEPGADGGGDGGVTGVDKKNDARFAYQTFLRRASAENKDPTLQNGQWALLMTLQHFIDLTYYDRNRYDERLRRLEAAMFARNEPTAEDACSPPPQ
jgi:hypothetical protein